MAQSGSGGFATYIEKTKQFSPNARLVLIYSAFTGLAFGVFRFLFNFYVLCLQPTWQNAIRKRK